jgi:hypothetical protein
MKRITLSVPNFNFCQTPFVMFVKRLT